MSDTAMSDDLDFGQSAQSVPVDAANPFAEEAAGSSVDNHAELEEEIEDKTLGEFIQMCHEKIIESDDRKEERYNNLDKIIATLEEDRKDLRQSRGFTELVTQFYDEIYHEPVEENRLMHFRDFIAELKFAFRKKKSSKPSEPMSKQQLIAEKKEQAKRKNQIRKLKKELKFLTKKAQVLQRQELSLDDMENESAFTKMTSINRKITKTAQALFTLENKPLKIGREFQKKFKLHVSEHECINKAINTRINQMFCETYKSKKNCTPKYAMPDLQDIVEIVEKLVEEHRLPIFNIADYSRTVLKEIGAEIKRRRQIETDESMHSYIYDDNLRPETFTTEENDPELQVKFEKQDKNKKSEKDVLDKYVQLSMEKKESEMEEEELSEDSETDSESETDDNIETLDEDDDEHDDNFDPDAVPDEEMDVAESETDDTLANKFQDKIVNSGSCSSVSSKGSMNDKVNGPVCNANEDSDDSDCIILD